MVAQLSLDNQSIVEQWPEPKDGSIYLNTGSCGRKPELVLEALKRGLEDSNINPTLSVFLDNEPWELARQAAAQLFDVEPKCLLLTQSTTQGMQLIMQSLLNDSDELVTTNHEHGSTKAMIRWLEETRAIKVRWHDIDPFAGSDSFCRNILDLVTKKTRLVQISEIDCATGWRPNLSMLASELDRMSIPLLVDGAHSPGHGIVRPGKYPLWVGSGHKWLGGPNGTGFVYVAPQLVSQIKPLWLSDKTYNSNQNDLLRFEYQGTTDVSKLHGLAAALRFYENLQPHLALERQLQLIRHLKMRLTETFTASRKPIIRTPNIESESTGMLTFTWSASQVPVEDLRETLWKDYRIWIQPDFYYGKPGHGIRVSCHISNTEAELDKLINALDRIIK